VGRVLEVLRRDEAVAAWLVELERVAGGGDVEVVLPPAEELPPLLLDLAVPHEDVNEIVGLRAVVAGDRELRWLLEGAVRVLVRDMGVVGPGVRPPYLPDELGPVARWFHVLAFAAALPYVRAYHRGRGVPDDVARRTLADLGRNVAVHRKRRGTRGLYGPHWLRRHFTGLLYDLGRLQFERARLDGATADAVAAAGVSVRPGDPHLEVHVADFSGPLTPAACDASVARAREFFPRHFPQERFTVAVCRSWLLDRQLARYLPEESNIVRFQRRFRFAFAAEEPSDAEPVQYVFGDPALRAEEMPRRTTLERAVGDHLRAGGHWYLGTGWFPL
jgi:GNAT-like C-terminal domain/N-acyltransferase N-terminal domain